MDWLPDHLLECTSSLPRIADRQPVQLQTEASCPKRPQRLRARTCLSNVKREVNPMIESVATAPTVDEAPATKSGKFQAGVRPYAQDYYVPDYVPTDTDLLCAFRIQPDPSTDMTELGGRGRRIVHRHVDRSLVEPTDQPRLLQGQGLPHRRRHRLYRLPDGPL